MNKERRRRIKQVVESLTPLLAEVESIKDDEYFREKIEAVVKTREWSKERLKELGFAMTDSKSNFLFVSHPKMAAAEIAAKLREEGIIVRHFNKPRIDNYLRISVGTDEEMQILTDTLARIL